MFPQCLSFKICFSKTTEEIVEHIVLYVGQTTLLKRIDFVLYKAI